MTDDIDPGLGRVLTQVADRLPDLPDRWAGVQRLRHRHRRRRLLSVEAGVAAVLAAGVAAIVVSHSPSTRVSVIAPVTGGRVGGSGTVLAAPGRPVRFCDPFALVAGTGIARAHAPDAEVNRPDLACLGVDVVGVDLARLTGRTVTDGVVSGQATLQGRYNAGVLHVDRQEEYTPDPPVAAGGYADHPRCPTPAGGWHRDGPLYNPDVGPAQSYQMAHPAEIVQLAIARPSRLQSLVLLLTDGDPAPVRAAVAASYHLDEVCVARSAYTRAQVSAATSDAGLRVSSGSTEILSEGLELDPSDDQVAYKVGAIVETPAIAAAVGRHPPGLVQVDAWLRPV